MIIYQTENFGKSYNYRSNPHKNWVVPPHIHEFSELVYTKEGLLTAYVNGKKYQVPEKHLMLILPNQIHEYTAETECSLRCAVFSNDHIPAFFRALQERVLQNPIADLSDAEALFFALEESDPEDTVRLCGILNLLCDRVLKSTALIPKPSGECALLPQVVNYLSENFQREITLKNLAKKLGYNEKYLSSLLHSLTGMNFRAFLASYRVDYAKQLLRSNRTTGLRISDIAFECGFSSINNFNRVFKEHTGMTPGKYKDT